MMRNVAKDKLGRIIVLTLLVSAIFSLTLFSQYVYATNVCSIEEVNELLDDYAIAHRDKDATAMSQLLADNFIHTAVRDWTSSVLWTKSDFISWINSTSGNKYTDLKIIQQKNRYIPQ